MSVPSKNIPTRIRSNPLLTALADALAGAIGSVVAALAFYPIDIAKTRAQAQRNTSSGVRHDLLMQSMKGWQRFARSRTLAALFSLVRREGPLRIFAGIEAKALQALLGSFVYFYAYAFVKGVMRRRTGGSLRPSLNLLAAALAGAVNQAFTLPLENITTRMQTAGPIRRPDSSGRPSSSRPTFGANSEGHDIAREAEDNSSGNGKESSMRNLVSTVGRHENPIAEGAGATSHAVRAVATRGGSEGGVESSMFGGAGTGGTTDRDPNLTITATGGSKPRSPGTVVDNLDVHDEGSAGVAGNGVERGAGANPSLPDLHASCSPDSPRQRPPRRQRQSLLSVARDLYLEGNGMGRFWRGFTPSLILTCNPAINYTTFDVLKALWLKRRAKSRAVAAVGPLHVGDEFLDPIEAFVIAAIAKSIATLVTYPLIRAKVILMTSSCSKTKSDQAEEVEGEEALTNEMDHEETSSDPKDGLSRTGTWNMAGESERRRIPTLAEKEKYLSRDGGGLGEGGASRMAHVLLDIVRSEGVAGLYAGCGAQLLHTILKSALLLATKEEIARVASSAVSLGGSFGADQLVGNPGDRGKLQDTARGSS